MLRRIVNSLEQGVLHQIVRAGRIAGERQREGPQGRHRREQTVAELGLHLLAASFQGGFQLLDEFGEARCRLVRAKAVVDGAELVAEM
jgi:hypothetical protein